MLLTRFCLSLLFSMPVLSGWSQLPVFSSGSRIYLVRHGEKAQGEDPPLSPGGIKRAGDLFRVLKDQGIRRIYLTDYTRSVQTADSLRIRLDIDTVYYGVDASCDDLLSKIAANGDQDKAILIIGHSNTIPLLIRTLGVAGYPRGNIPADEYDNLFLVRFIHGKAELKREKYGRE
jgi:broad specificity phosphatase PhoE